jgi:seryl-tRNA synthetase
MIKTLQNVLASVNVIAAITYPLLNYNQSVLVRAAGVSCGVVAVLLSRGGIFQPIIDLNSQRWRLKKEVKSLGSQISFLERKLQETATAKEEEFRKHEQALTDKEQSLNQQLQEAAAAKEAQLNEREQALVEAEKELEKQI